MVSGADVAQESTRAFYETSASKVLSNADSGLRQIFVIYSSGDVSGRSYLAAATWTGKPRERGDYMSQRLGINFAKKPRWASAHWEQTGDNPMNGYWKVVASDAEMEQFMLDRLPSERNARQWLSMQRR